MINSHIKVVAQLSKVCKMEQRKSPNGTNVCGNVNREECFELC